MQVISAPLQASLALRTGSASVSRVRAFLFELYSSDYLPAEGGDFDPADAIALWGRAGITWLGRDYRRAVVSHGDITRFLTSQFNSVSMTLDNEDSGSGGFMSQFVVSNEVEGLRLVIRMIDPTIVSPTLADSIVLAVNRLDRPTSLDTETCSEGARQDLASIDHEIPKRTFSPFDPNGRSADDPLYEGFQFAPTTGFFNVYSTVRSGGFLGLFSHNRLVANNQQFSSEQGTNANQVVPLIFGRCQMEMIPAYWADIGFYIAGLWVVAGHKVSAIKDIKVQTDGFQIGPGGWTPTIIAAHTHLGDLGGTGTNATADTVAGNLPANTALLSRTAYQGLAVFGPESPTQASANPGKDAVPTLSCIVLGEADLPVAGAFTGKGFTDNPAYLTRFVLTSIIGLDPSLIHDAECIKTAAHCDEIIKDDTNAELLLLTTPDAQALANNQFSRLSSSGLIDTRSVLYEIDDSSPNPLFSNRIDALEYNPSLLVPIFDGPIFPGIPQAVTAIGLGSTISVTFTANLQAGSLTPGDFIVLKNGAANVVTAASASGRVVTLNLTSSIASPDVVTVEYTGSAIIGITGVPAAFVGPWPVLLGTTPALLCPAGYHFDSGLCVPDNPGPPPPPPPPIGVSGGDTQLTSGVPLSGQSVTAGNWKYYYINIPQGVTQIQVIAAGSGDGALYTRGGSKPDLVTYACRAYNPSPEICTSTGPNAGMGWIGVYGVSGTTNFTITATLSGSGLPGTLEPLTYLRKRYTFSAPLTDKVKATSFLFDTLLPSFRGFIVIGPDGRLRIRSEKPADSTYLRADANGGTAATGSATLNTLPAAGDTLTINGVLFTFRTAPTSSLEVLIGASINATVNTLVAMLNTSTDPLVSVATYTNEGSGVLGITHDTVDYGSTGNAFTLAKVSTHITVSGATLSGGLDGDISIQVNDVAPWRASKQGLLLINPGDIFSETRVVTAAPYSTAGNSIPLVAAVTGTTTLTRSAATMAGGDGANTPASGTFTVGGSPVSGDTITATIDDVAIVYTLNAQDTLETAAAMLSASINGEWRLRGYIRASVIGAVITVTSTLGSLTVAPLLNSHAAVLANPTMAPVAVAASSGALPAGSYRLGYSRTTPLGETLISPVTTIIVDGTQKIDVSAIALGGAAGLNFYLSKIANDPALVFLINNTGGAFSINAAPQPNARGIPLGNSAGEETIRVMASFNERNILKGKFSWPLADQGTPTNQVKISYVEASKGFVKRDLYVNDYDHQATTQKVNSVEIDGSGIDNFNQANRIANFRLSKEREGDFFVSWDTDVAGVVFEEGDVVCVNEWNPRFFNLPVRIEQVAIHEDCSVGFTARIYSTRMYSDQAGQHPIVLPTTLKYLNQPPPVAANLVLTADGTFITGIIGDFDFSGFVAKQVAHILIKGPAASEPSDSEYRFIDTVSPDDNAHGHFEIRAIVGGQYWVKVVTESAFGKKASSGHPVATIDIRPAAVTDVLVNIDAFGDLLVQCAGHARTVEEPATWSLEIWDSAARIDPATHMKGILPMTAGTSHACLMNSVHVLYGVGSGNPPDDTPLPGGLGTIFISTATDKNNLFSLPWDGILVVGPEHGTLVSGVALEAIESTFQRFDFTGQWLGADGNAIDNVTFTAALQTRADANPVSDLFTPDLSVSPLLVEWSAGTLPGTIKETFKSFGTEIPGTSRDNVDPGFGSASANYPLSGGSQDPSTYVVYRRGPRYSFVVVGSEYRLYLNFGSQNQQLIAVVASGPTGPAFPLRLAGETGQPLQGSVAIMNITRGGDQLNTIYSVRDQIAKQGSQQSQFFFDVYQDAKSPLPQGIRVSVVAPP